MRTLRILFLISLWLLSAPAGAVDGVIEINQERALAGGVTPGDDPGFPVVLTLPGSYRLTGSLEVTGDGQTAILVIGAARVALDLNGFSLRCSLPDGDSCAGDSVGVSAGNGHLEVRDGTIRGFLGAGIRAGDRSRVENVDLFENGMGIDLANGGTVRNCLVSNNLGDGIQGGSLLVEGNVAIGNGGDGISCGACTVHNNVSDNNSGDGIQVSTSGTVTGNSTSFNLRHGLNVGVGTVSGNSSSNNTRCGLSASTTTGFSDNVFQNNNGGGNNRQVSLGVSLGFNLCGATTTCTSALANLCP